MKAAPIPKDDQQRLSRLYALKILDTPAEERFDRITRLATRLFDVPIALVSFVDENRQWSKSCQGLLAGETPRANSFCGHAILSSETLVIPDTLLDECFADNPLVTGEPKIRFYAGHPLTTSDGSRIGTLCLQDHQPRQLSDDELLMLRDLAAIAKTELNEEIFESQQAEEALRQSEERFRQVITYTSAHVYVTEFSLDGNQINHYLSPNVEAMTGYPPEVFLRDWSFWPSTLIHPDDRKAAAAQVEEFKQGQHTEVEYRMIRADGKIIWVRDSVRIEKNTSNDSLMVYGVVIDITAAKRAEETLAKRATELETVARVGTVASSSLDIGELLQNVVDLTKENFGLYHVQIYLLDETGVSFDLTAGAGTVGHQMVTEGWSIPADQDESLVTRVASQRTGIIVDDVRKDPSYWINPLLPDTRSELAVPLIAGDRVAGVLDVQSDEVNHFTPDDIRIQTTLATQVAVALENARLFEAERITAAENEEQARALAQLNDLSKQLNQVDGENEIFRLIVTRTPDIIQADRVSIALLSDVGDDFEVLALQGETKVIPVGARVPMAGTAVGTCVREQRAVTIRDAAESEYLDAHRLAEQGLSSMICVPLVIGDRPVGSLNSAAKEPNVYRLRDESLAFQIASLLAAAIENQRLLAETKVALAEVEAVQRQYTVQAWETYRAKHAAITREQAREGLAPLAESLPAAVQQAISHKQTIVILDQPSATNSQLNGENHPSPPDMAASDLVVPLTVRGEIIGILGLQELDEARTWSQEEIALVEAVGEQLAQAAENLRLIDETQRRAAREKLMNDINDKIQSAQSLDEALQVAVKEVGLSLKVPQTVVRLALE
ncbi:MAG TPA: GAF domain-containing protein [Anaerolineae bacterium]